MPELPEVEHVVRYLHDYAAGLTIDKIKIQDDFLLKNVAPGKLRRSTEGSKLKSVRRVGKYLLFTCNRGLIVNHMRMSGRWLVNEGDRTRMAFQLTDNKSLYFDDLRRLGTIHFFENQNREQISFLRKLGPDPLRDLNLEKLNRILQSRQEIKRLLLDQEKISGIGNIYASEILFEANIHPFRQANQLAGSEIKKLHRAITDILDEALAEEGTSIDSFYKTPGGQPGNFQHHLRVYDRKGEPCHLCSSPVQKKQQGQRSTYFCLSCQI